MSVAMHETDQNYGILFLNQARAWFLRIASVRELVFVCVSAPEAVNN